MINVLKVDSKGLRRHTDVTLINFMSQLSFYTTWKHHKTSPLFFWSFQGLQKRVNGIKYVKHISVTTIDFELALTLNKYISDTYL